VLPPAPPELKRSASSKLWHIAVTAATTPEETITEERAGTVTQTIAMNTGGASGAMNATNATRVRILPVVVWAFSFLFCYPPCGSSLD
jgi:hypothetical protein